LTELMI